MPGYSDPGFDTLALHAGAAPDPATGARAVPIHLTTSFVFESSDHAAALFNLERAGHVYSRISNPTNAVLEQRMAALEGGIGAIATASGQAALHLAIATLMGAGSHIVASTALYGGSQNLLHYTLRRFGIETTFREARRHRRLARRRAAQHQAVLWRDRGQPGPGRAGHPHRRRHRARGRRAAAGGLHPHLALADAALRAWRRPGLPLGHQVPVAATAR
jgi:O-acetylhomoserine/O-acetylserine sulfhydrylase-like pyridoxal-dependent enzyme